MRALLLFLLFTLTSWAKPIVLVSYFDSFNNAPFNNSEIVAKNLFQRFQNHPEIELKICGLQTVFDKSFYELENCVHESTSLPFLVISLGESSCNLKVETMARNLDHTKGPDNEGNERRSSPIDQLGPTEIGFNYPLPSMYCELNQPEKDFLELSNNAGGFVCNNLAYRFSKDYLDIPFGFIHVPAHNCRELSEKTTLSISILTKMISKGILTTGYERLKTKKADLQKIRKKYSQDKCLGEFYKRTKGIDEKGLWPFSWIK